MWTRVFWVQAAERALGAFAIMGLVLTGGDARNVIAIGWQVKLLMCLAAAFISVLKSIAGSCRVSTGVPARLSLS